METIIVAILVLYGLSIVLKLVGPWLMRWLLGRAAKKMFADVGGEPAQEKSSPRRDGNGVLRPRVREGQSISDILGGEYVDYEEV